MMHIYALQTEGVNLDRLAELAAKLFDIPPLIMTGSTIVLFLRLESSSQD